MEEGCLRGIKHTRRRRCGKASFLNTVASERQEARTKVKHDSLRLGSVGVLRTGTIIAETWEDGQMLKDLNAQLKQLLETKEVIERQRKLLKKRQNGDKSDGTDSESGAQEEDIIPDEIYKSRLASIKRLVHLPSNATPDL
ncbi:hypothetical protein F2Q69_00044396 [Brassica cretica]|uniref:Uncharacterized protein n=1 Tax=Brassica cretica TaxID=69181 RepID=A0A8S9NLG1_BRACR|nr:hypothetical protein F2Q69_00044396 [Brassica cretica]